jgi:hypothetical protein
VLGVVVGVVDGEFDKAYDGNLVGLMNKAIVGVAVVVTVGVMEAELEGTSDGLKVGFDVKNVPEELIDNVTGAAVKTNPWLMLGAAERFK